MDIHVKLLVLAGSRRGKALELDGRTNLLIGRDAGLAFPADARMASYHALLEIVPPFVHLRDLETESGTFVNGQRIGWEPVLLRHCDVVTAGDTELRVEIEEVLPVTDSMFITEDADDSVKTELFLPPNRELGAAKVRCMRCGARGVNEVVRVRSQRMTFLCNACRDSMRHEPLLGTHLRLVRELGCGGMGCVFLVIDERSEEPRALKQLIPGATLPPNEWERAQKMFLREANAQAAVRHPNIVAVHEILQVQPAVFGIVMEYVEGVSAERLLEDAGSGLPVSLVLDIARATLRALIHAHAAGIVHRDIKDANVLVTLDERGGLRSAKVGDFGLARWYQESALSGIDTPGFMAGTLPYMPPEQLTDFRNVKPAGDLYAFGAMLYRLLTARYPLPEHNGEKGNAYLAILTSTAPPIRSLNPYVPEVVADLIHRCLSKNPGDRPTSAEQILARLDASPSGP
ncbi:MAG: FHA domain-containing serine/threonine-protein kinase [Polyangiaceae bacterium]